MRVLSLVFVLFFVFSANCQLTKGYFQYSIDVEAMDTLLKTRQSVALLRDSKMELYFTKDKSRMDFKMGQVNTISIIVDRKKNTVLSLNSSMMGKAAQTGLATDIPIPKKDSSIEVTFSEEKRKILDYNCKKAVLTENNVETTYWYTTEIQVDGKDYSILNPNIPGFPMQFSKTQDGVLMTFELSNIRKELEDEKQLFSTEVPEGYMLLEQN